MNSSQCLSWIFIDTTETLALSSASSINAQMDIPATNTNHANSTYSQKNTTANHRPLQIHTTYADTT